MRLPLILVLAAALPALAAPRLSHDSISLTPKIADISSGSTTVTARFRLTDPTPGSRLGDARLFVTRQAGGLPITLTSTPISKQQRTGGDASDGFYSVTLNIPGAAEPGDWDLYFQLAAAGSPDFEIDLKIKALNITSTPAPIGAPTLSSFTADRSSVDLTTAPGRIVTSFDLADPDSVIPPILRLASGTDAREFNLTEIHRTAAGDSGTSFRYAAWLPPGLPAGTYHWSVIAIDDTGAAGSTRPVANSLERIPAGNPALTVTNTGPSEEFGFAKNIGEPPFLDALTLTPTTVDLSTPYPEILGSLTFAEDTSGLASATVFLAGPTPADRIELPLTPADITTGDTLSGSIQFALPLPPTSRAATYTVGLDLADLAGNTTTYGGPSGDSLPPATPDSVTLTNPLPTPPPSPFSVTRARFGPDSIDLTNNPADVIIEFEIDDPGSTFRSAAITATPFITGTGQHLTATITRADLTETGGDTHTYATTLHFPLGAIPGPWNVNLALTGTSNTLAADIGNLQITSFGNIDTTTPALTGFSTDTPNIDVTGAPASAVFTLGLTGFAAPDTGWLSFSNPSHPDTEIGPFTFTTATRIGGNDAAGTYNVVATFPAATPTGTWYPHVVLTDQYNLTSTYGGTDPTLSPPLPLGIADTVTVTDTGTPPYDAFLANNPTLTETSPSADPDLDLLPNIIELLLGTDPTTPTFPSPLQLTTTGTSLRLTFPVDRPNLTTSVGAISFSGQVSTTLRTRNQIPTRSLSGGHYRIETPITPATPRFLNLRATSQ